MVMVGFFFGLKMVMVGFFFGPKMVMVGGWWGDASQSRSIKSVWSPVGPVGLMLLIVVTMMMMVVMMMMMVVMVMMVVMMLMMIQAKNDEMDTLASMSIVLNNLKYILLWIFQL